MRIFPAREEAGDARLDDVHRVAEGRLPELAQERAAQEAAGLLDGLEDAARDGPVARGLHAPGVEREDAEVLLEELRRGAGELRLEELEQLGRENRELDVLGIQLFEALLGEAVERGLHGRALFARGIRPASEVQRPRLEGLLDGLLELAFQGLLGDLFFVKKAAARLREGLALGRVAGDHAARLDEATDQVLGLARSTGYPEEALFELIFLGAAANPLFVAPLARRDPAKVDDDDGVGGGVLDADVVRVAAVGEENHPGKART